MRGPPRPQRSRHAANGLVFFAQSVSVGTCIVLGSRAVPCDCAGEVSIDAAISMFVVRKTSTDEVAVNETADEMPGQHCRHTVILGEPRGRMRGYSPKGHN